VCVYVYAGKCCGVVVQHSHTCEAPSPASACMQSCHARSARHRPTSHMWNSTGLVCTAPSATRADCLSLLEHCRSLLPAILWWCVTVSVWCVGWRQQLPPTATRADRLALMLEHRRSLRAALQQVAIPANWWRCVTVCWYGVWGGGSSCHHQVMATDSSCKPGDCQRLPVARLPATRMPDIHLPAAPLPAARLPATRRQLW
jgi:hypothetical protein